MSAPTGKIKGNSFNEKMIEGLDCLPSNSQGWIKELQEMFNEAVCNNAYVLRHVSDWFKTGEMCKETVETDPWQLEYVPDHFKTQMCSEAVSIKSLLLAYVPNHLKTQGMCSEAVRREPGTLKLVPDHLKTQEICDKAVRKCSSLLMHVPDWFATREWVYM